MIGHSSAKRKKKEKGYGRYQKWSEEVTKKLNMMQETNIVHVRVIWLGV